MNKKIEYIVKQFLKCIGNMHANVLVIIILSLKVKQISYIFHILIVVAKYLQHFNVMKTVKPTA